MRAYFKSLMAVLVGASPVLAVDGVILIDQNRALAGNVTPGDTPGFPVTISQPGSYRLSGNLTVPNANTTAILITADDVTLDLNGFTIKGPTVCTSDSFETRVTSCEPTGSGIGIDGATGLSTIIGSAVLNGTVRGFGLIGVALGHGCRAEKLIVEHSGINGLTVNGNCSVHANVVGRNGNHGIVATRGSVVSQNTAYQNGGIGIFAESATVLANHSRHNLAGLQFASSSASKSGYANNVLTDNNFTVVGGSVAIQTGGNVCNSAACP